MLNKEETGYQSKAEFKPTMFYEKAHGYRYENPTNRVTGQNLYFPVEIDTEYTHIANLQNPDNPTCVNITAQCRAIDEPFGQIYAYPDIRKISRHKVLETDFVVYDYLKDLGWQITPIKRRYGDEPHEIPWMQIDCFAFFALAEFPRVLSQRYFEDFDELVINTSPKIGIEQGRRLRTFHREGFQYLPWLEMPWIISINGYAYRVRLCIYDTSALQGLSSYKNLCANTGVNLQYKNVFSTEEKGRMLEMYVDNPDDFDNYALGDLYNYDALLGNADNFKIVYKKLGISKYFTDPKLTIGSTIANLFSSVVKELFKSDSENSDVINLFCKYGSADYLKYLSTTGAINAKVRGGRCRNNKPTSTYHKSLITDIDINGCYGDGLRVQTYPIGLPIVLDYPKSYKNNKYLSLRQFIKKYSDELVPGLYQIVASTKEEYLLDNQQDYFASFIPPKSMRNLATDEDSQSTDKWWEIENFGESKILKNQIINGIVTHDGLQWIYNVASPKLRNELLDNLEVVTAMWYPASSRVGSINELLEAHKNHYGVNTTEIKTLKGLTSKVSIEQRCHAWYGIKLGEMLVDTLMKERAKHPKKTPLNTLYKLCVNTIYGDMVSPFFKIGNVVVGNNITARARALAWCMEKGLNGWQTITDGCAFDLNKVTYPKSRHRVNSSNSLHTYLRESQQQLTYAPLRIAIIPSMSSHYIAEYKLDGLIIKVKLDCESTFSYSISEFKELVNMAAFEHLQKLFIGLDVLHKPSTDIQGKPRIGQYQFEVKDFYVEGTFHGSGNYWLNNEWESNYKMRSYQKGDKEIVAYDGNKIIIERGKSPAYLFLESLRNSDSIIRSSVYLKNRILKIGDYRNNYDSWSKKRVYPGVTITEARLLREFSLGQFTFNTYKQYRSWLRQHKGFLKKYNQSYEMFYLNDDGTLDFQNMVTEIEEMIRNDEPKYKYRKLPDTHNQHRLYDDHISTDDLNQVRNDLDDMYRKRDDEDKD